LTGFFLTASAAAKMKIKIATTCGGTGDAVAVVAGGNAVALASADPDGLAGTVTFSSFTDGGVALKVCLFAQASSIAGTDTFADTTNGEVVNILHISSMVGAAPAMPPGANQNAIKYAPNTKSVVYTLVTTVGLTTNDKIKVIKSGSSCTVDNADGSNIVAGGAGIARATATGDTAATIAFTLTPDGTAGQATVTIAAQLAGNKICLIAGSATGSELDGAATYAPQADTGTITVAMPTITSVNYNRQVKGDQVSFSLTGFLLINDASKLKVKIATACSTNTDVGNVITAGDGILLATAVSNGLSGDITFTLDQAYADAKICLWSHDDIGGLGVYADLTNADTVTVIDITAVDTPLVGKDVWTLMTFTAPITLTTSDKVKWVPASASCDDASGSANPTPTTGGTGKVLFSSTTVKYKLSVIEESIVLCLAAGQGAKAYPKYHTTTVTIHVRIPKITAYSAVVTSAEGKSNGATTSVHSEVATTLTFTGFGLSTDTFVAVSETTNCNTILTGGAAQALGGAVQTALVGDGGGGVSQDTETATVTFTLTKAFVDAA
jgi:hypothetical protein